MENIPQSIRAKIIEKLRTRFNTVKFNMTPMIDIVFLLLVFFLATARFRPLEAKLPMQIPSPQGGEQAQFSLVEPLMISLESQDNGIRIIVAGTEFTYPEVTSESLIAFADELNAVYQRQKRTPSDPVELDCAQNLSWEHLVKVYNLMYGMGITNITFVTD
jgi:biopolymer transport protein ExbD